MCVPKISTHIRHCSQQNQIIVYNLPLLDESTINEVWRSYCRFRKAERAGAADDTLSWWVGIHREWRSASAARALVLRAAADCRSRGHLEMKSLELRAAGYCRGLLVTVVGCWLKLFFRSLWPGADKISGGVWQLPFGTLTSTQWWKGESGSLPSKCCGGVSLQIQIIMKLYPRHL